MRWSFGRPANWLLLAGVFVLGGAVAGPILGNSDGNDNDNPAGSKIAKPAKETPKSPVTPEMETAATQFVRLNHPELAELLGQLKTSKPAQYQQAIRDLSRAATTLATTEKNDPKKYVLDLRGWQVNSQIQVIAARLAMSATPELKEELKAKLLEQIDIRLEQQKFERERTESRLKRLDESIAKLEGSRDAEAARAFDKITRTTPKPTAKKAKETKNR